MPSRFLRGSVVGSLLIGLSALGHASAGGDVDPATLLALAAAAVTCCVALSAWEWTLPRLLVVLGLGQVMVHLALEATMAPMPSMTGLSAAPTAAARMSDMTAMDPAGGVLAPAPADPGAWMLWAHVLAVVVGAVLVRYGEVAALALFAAIASMTRPRLVTRALARPAAPWLPAPVVVSWEPIGGRTILLGTTMRRRGPPAPACG